ncbi:MAG: hypothetical protein JNN23_05915, partial [Chryseobacterium gambrini]|nr:hypothetical protein [Chryseobacterium gambrini]
FTIEFDPGTTATLTPVFPDTATTAEADVPHVFTPGFWDKKKNENVIFRAIFIPFNKEKMLIDGLSCYFHEGEIYLPQYFS